MGGRVDGARTQHESTTLEIAKPIGPGAKVSDGFRRGVSPSSAGPFAMLIAGHNLEGRPNWAVCFLQLFSIGAWIIHHSRSTLRQTRRPIVCVHCIYCLPWMYIFIESNRSNKEPCPPFFFLLSLWLCVLLDLLVTLHN